MSDADAGKPNSDDGDTGDQKPGNGNSGSGNGAAGAPKAAEASQPTPEVRMMAQYVKDISFESPRVPKLMPHMVGQPEVNVGVNVNVHELNKDHSEFEVELALEGKGTKDGEVVFIVELVYAARVSIMNVPDEMKPPIVLVETPRIIFPFARRILADLVRDGGFQPLLIEPIDFAALFRQRMEQMQASGAAPASA